MCQTVFYQDHARQDDHEYAISAGEAWWGPDFDAINAAAQALLVDLVNDASRPAEA